MRTIPKKNYIIFIFMVIAVIIITFLGVRIYNNSLRPTSDFYNYVKIIKTDEIDLYLNENPQAIIYIADKYDLNNEILEKKLKQKIVKFNLFNNFIYLDKSDLNSKFLDKFNKKYDALISTEKIPTLIIFNDGKVIEIHYELTENLINSLDFEGIR